MKMRSIPCYTNRFAIIRIIMDLIEIPVNID